MRFTCRWCKTTFIGRNAVHAWSSHTWAHWPEAFASTWVSDDTT